MDIDDPVYWFKWTTDTNIPGETYANTGYDKASQTSVVTITSAQLLKLRAKGSTHTFTCAIYFSQVDHYTRSATQTVTIIDPG